MVKCKHKGPRAKSRKPLTKKVREKGTPNINKILTEFEVGQKVHVKPDSSMTSGLPHRRFFGKTGQIKRKQGNCYVVELKDMAKNKEVIIHPVHLKTQKVTK